MCRDGLWSLVSMCFVSQLQLIDFAKQACAIVLLLLGRAGIRQRQEGRLFSISAGTQHF